MTERRKRKINQIQHENNQTRKRRKLNHKREERVMTEEEFHVKEIVYGSGAGTIVSPCYGIVAESIKKTKITQNESKRRIVVDLISDDDEDNVKIKKMIEPKKIKKVRRNKKKQIDTIQKFDLKTRRMIHCVETQNQIVVETESGEGRKALIDTMNYVKNKYDDHRQKEMMKSLIICSRKNEVHRLKSWIIHYVGVFVVDIVWNNNKNKYEQEKIPASALREAYVVIGTPGRLDYILSQEAKLEALKENLRNVVYWDSVVLHLGHYKISKGFLPLKGMDNVEKRLKDGGYGVIDINLCDEDYFV